MQPGTGLQDEERSPRFYARGRQSLLLSWNTPFLVGSTAAFPMITLVAAEKEGTLSRAPSSCLTAGGREGAVPRLPGSHQVAV